jgi:hypothetical protein
MDEPFRDNYSSITPFTDPVKVGQAVAYLVINGSEDETGQILTINGGFS